MHRALSVFIKGERRLKRQYFLTDFDGTLLKNNSSMSDYTIKVIKDAISQGVIISYATARSYTSSNSVTSMIPWESPLVLYNGALIYDPIKKEVISGCWLSEETTDLIIAEGKKHNLIPLLFCLDKFDQEKVLHEKLIRLGDIQFVKERENDPRFQEVHKLQCPDEHRTLYITYIGGKSELEPLKSSLELIFKDQIGIHFMEHTSIQNHYYLELTHSKANKEEGLIQWSKRVGCEVDEVTVFGDNLNDLGMFLKAGKKIAVENANPVIKELADEIIKSNEEDGVESYIYGKIAYEESHI